MVICLERGTDLHMAHLMPLPLTVSCSSEIKIGFILLVLAHPGRPGERAVKRVCVCARACACACACACARVCVRVCCKRQWCVSGFQTQLTATAKEQVIRMSIYGRLGVWNMTIPLKTGIGGVRSARLSGAWSSRSGAKDSRTTTSRVVRRTVSTSGRG